MKVSCNLNLKGWESGIDFLPFGNRLKLVKQVVAIMVVLTWSLAPLRGDAPTSLVFSLNPVDVGKVVVLMYKGPKIATLCEVTFSKEKQAELAQLAVQGAGKPIAIMVNGKQVTEITFETGKTGHSVKFPCDSPEDAFAIAKQLLAPLP